MVIPVINQNHTSMRLFSKSFFAVVLVVAFYATTSSANVSQHRQVFLDAEAALESGNTVLFEELSYKSRDYILYPYLRYYDLRQRIDTVNEKEISGFLKKYKEYPFVHFARVKWLKHLAENKQWSKYLKYYRGQSRRDLRCHYLTASLVQPLTEKKRLELLRQGEKLWLSAKKDPKECKPIFEALASYGRINTALRWERIELAMKAGNSKMASQLSKPFGKRDKKLVDLWQKIYKKPEKLFNYPKMRRNGLVKRKIAYQAIERVARKDAYKADEMWRKAKRWYGFNLEEKQKMKRHLALWAAYQAKPDALHMLKQVPKQQVTGSIQNIRIRLALKQQKWSELLSALQAVDSGARDSVRWKYWQARALEQLGMKQRAQTVFDELSGQTNYYGFLAADRLNKPYQFVTEPLKRDEAGLTMLKQIPGIQRTEELYMLDRVTEARREWNQVIKKLDEPLVKLAAILAHDWQWHDNAIFTVAKTSHRKDLDLRFPTPYRDLIYNAAENYGIDPEWIYGVARRESAFNVLARSSAGAMGLMQILPSTAKIQSRSLGMASPSYRDLLTEDRNIVLGSSYLNKMLKRFSGNQVVATAAYNAGPNRVSKWLPRDGSKVSADIWVDTIPYKETREYVRAVMAYATIFDWKLNKNITPLRDRMEIIAIED